MARDAIEVYIQKQPEDRQDVLRKLRATMLKHKPKGVQEQLCEGFPGLVVPHSVYPPGYHCDRSQPLPFASYCFTTKHLGLHLWLLYMDAEEKSWFEKEWKARGLRWDAGVCCVRVRDPELLPYDLVGKALRRRGVRQFIATYEGRFGAGPGKCGHRGGAGGKATGTKARATGTKARATGTKARATGTKARATGAKARAATKRLATKVAAVVRRGPKRKAIKKTVAKKGKTRG